MDKKQRKEEFYKFLLKVYEPSVVSAENIFKAITKVDSFCKKNGSICMLDTTNIDDIRNIRSAILNSSANLVYGIKRPDPNRITVLEKYILFLESINDSNKDEEIEQKNKVIDDVLEGMITESKILRRKRNRIIREQCAKTQDYRCYVCGFKFEELYGERGIGYIQVHHKKKMADYDEEHSVRIEDLCALCSNCHSMIHRTKDPMSVEDLKQIVDSKKEK